MTKISDGWSRRNVLGVAAAGMLGMRMDGGHADTGAAAAADPRRSALGQVKLGATLDGSAAFWSYSGMIYAVRDKLRPLSLLRLSGCQVQWADRQADGAYRMLAKTLTFFRAVDGGAFLDHFDNPLTGQRNAVRANIFAGGGALYPADGSAMRLTSTVKASESAPQGIAAQPDAGVGRVEWTLTRDSVVLDTDHAFNVSVQPQLEAQTRSADRQSFFDPTIKRLPARYTGTTITPWLGWLEMAEVAGHLVWHTQGEKLFELNDLPADYRSQAGAMLEPLAVRPG